MPVRTRAAACIGVAGAVALFPVAAQAKTKTVTMGEPSSTTNKFNNVGADVNDFFPHRVTVHVGDRVRFVATAFHTVDIPPRGAGPLTAFVAAGGKVSGATDAAGQAFWFNGQDQVGVNPRLLKNIFGKHVTFRGTKRVESGASPGPAPPFTVKFTKAGKYTYFCNIHIGMKGVVRVVKKGRRIPSAGADRRAVKRQVKRDFNTAKKLATTTPPSGIVDVGVHGPGGVEFYGMVPGTVTVKVGTQLRFRMGPRSVENHTATFGPGDPEKEPSSYLGQLSATFQSFGPFDPRAIYPSEQPPSIATLTSTSHGNGFWNTGLMDTSSATPLPEAGAVTFGAPGTYNYYCLIHSFMHGVITVTP
jgi:plastocyanin